MESGFRKIRCDNKGLDRHLASVRTHDDLDRGIAPMTKPMMDLRALVEKSGDADLPAR
ncbi:hypothetical protein KL86PLE_120049 [uncultured Pleomorphomonas sp.]|uniref:Transposase n=1 Tax=uncultured Pleomorphomonas sp. TaxID=442121 RepID=A0A212L803_9HYPH|nr:hypothetical protein KL86PLE_120049 [uncultured Pleomorphomonas sp.]